MRKSNPLLRLEVLIQYSVNGKGELDMNAGNADRNHFDGLHASGLAFWMISLMHDNPLLPLVKNPGRLLQAAGLRQGQKVLEVGCGPGFFTIPASRIVGEEGVIYATDINRRAIKRVEAKMRRYGMDNIKPVLGNAADCDLQDGSIDLAFVFGMRHIAGGLGGLVSEMYRILKPGGTLSFERTTGSAARLVEDVERAGFVKTGNRGRIFLFAKGGNTAE